MPAGSHLIPVTRRGVEVKRALDILSTVLDGNVPMQFPTETRHSLMAQVDALCWVLQRPENNQFGLNLQKIIEIAASLGYVLRDSRGLWTPPHTPLPPTRTSEEPHVPAPPTPRSTAPAPTAAPTRLNTAPAPPAIAQRRANGRPRQGRPHRHSSA